jgi:hypothetical protein
MENEKGRTLTLDLCRRNTAFPVNLAFEEELSSRLG